MPISGDKLIDMRTWGNETMGARPPAEMTLVGIPGTERRSENPEMAAIAGAFAVSASGNVQEDKYLTGVGDKNCCV